MQSKIYKINKHIKNEDAPVIVKRNETRITYPHFNVTQGRHDAEVRAEIFEGLTRSFFIASVIIHEKPDITINGIRLRDYYKKQILRSLCDKKSPYYVGTYDELFKETDQNNPVCCFQQTVETCALVIWLSACRAEIWDDYTKNETADVVKDCYDNSEFDMGDVIKISRGTTKQDELFEYVEAPDYYKERVRDYDEYDYDKDDFDLSR